MAGGSSRLTFGDLEGMVRERLEETIRLEFKRELPEAGKNEGLARPIAAMANSEGGTIIYGVDEDGDGRASALCPFAVGKSGERITLVARSVIDEPLSLSAVYAVADDKRPEMGYLVVEVPKSDRGPHLVDGRALGRTAKTTATLSRRQLGELFARSPGFAQEFGLVVGKPGRVLVRAISEAYQESTPFEPGKIRTGHDYFLLFENDGDTDVFDVSWEWVAAPSADEGPAATPFVSSQDPFPLAVLHPGGQVRLGVSIALGTGVVSVRTCWRDVAGNPREQAWPTVW